MKKLTYTVHVFAVCLLVLAASTIANAQATRTWVSGVGSDANPCSRTAPCQTFAGAIGKTLAGGEISVLDPHGYGSVNITKSITINGEGSLASVLVGLSGTGITVNAGSLDTVYLKNLDINGAGNGATGISWIAGNALIIEKVRIYNMTNTGLNVNKTASGFLSVTNSNITNCVSGGLVAQTSAGLLRAEIDNTKVFGCTSGFKAIANAQLTLKNSTASGCGTAGFHALGGSAVLNLQSCTATHNGDGIKTELGGIVRLGQSTVSNNITKGLDTASGGSVESYQDNYISGNPNSDAVSPIGKS
ncbi:MAG TPA: right-handed parallel beta-helix repeat-containing protein [Pyrinomonadaceae bacterium]